LRRPLALLLAPWCEQLRRPGRRCQSTVKHKRQTWLPSTVHRPAAQPPALRAFPQVCRCDDRPIWPWKRVAALSSFAPGLTKLGGAQPDSPPVSTQPRPFSRRLFAAAPPVEPTRFAEAAQQDLQGGLPSPYQDQVFCLAKCVDGDLLELVSPRHRHRAGIEENSFARPSEAAPGTYPGLL
jgi:hypothetical protein